MCNVIQHTIKAKYVPMAMTRIGAGGYLECYVCVGEYAPKFTDKDCEIIKTDKYKVQGNPSIGDLISFNDNNFKVIEVIWIDGTRNAVLESLYVHDNEDRSKMQKWVDVENEIISRY